MSNMIEELKRQELYRRYFFRLRWDTEICLVSELKLS